MDGNWKTIWQVTKYSGRKKNIPLIFSRRHLRIQTLVRNHQINAFACLQSLLNLLHRAYKILEIAKTVVGNSVVD